MGRILSRNHLLKSQGRNLWKVLKDAPTHAFLIVIKFSFTEAWLQPRRPLPRAGQFRARGLGGHRHGPCSLPSAPQGPLPWVRLAILSILPAESLSLTHLLPLEFRCQQSPSVCLWVQGVCSFLPHRPSVPTGAPAVFTPLPSTLLTSSSPWRGSFSRVRGGGAMPQCMCHDRPGHHTKPAPGLPPCTYQSPKEQAFLCHIYSGAPLRPFYNLYSHRSRTCVGLSFGNVKGNKTLYFVMLAFQPASVSPARGSL